MNTFYLNIENDLAVTNDLTLKVRHVNFNDKEKLEDVFSNIKKEEVNLIIYGNAKALVKLGLTDFKVYDLKIITEILIKQNNPNIASLYRSLTKKYDIVANASEKVQMMKTIMLVLKEHYNIDFNFIKKHFTEAYLDSTSLANEVYLEELNTKAQVVIKNKYHNHEFKKYCFLDLEFSNIYEAKPKICELSYVITDNNFNQVSEEELVINPGIGEENEFQVIEGKDLHLKYEANDYEGYRKAYEFCYYQKKLEELFSNKDTLFFFYSPTYDLAALKYAFNRYNSKLPEFILVDSQELYLDRYKMRPNLGQVSKDEYPESDHAMFHSSLVDAYWTMMITKKYSECYNNNFYSENLVFSSNYLAIQASVMETRYTIRRKHDDYKDIFGSELIELIKSGRKR